MKKSIISSLLCLVMLMQLVPVSFANGAENEGVIINEGFNNLVTNARGNTGVIKIDGTDGKVVEYGKSNKALMVNDSPASVKMVSAPVVSSELGNNFVYSFDLRKNPASKYVTVNIGFANGNTKYPALRIQDNTVFFEDGRRIGGVSSSDFTSFALIYNRANKVISVYINGEKKLNEWRFYNMGSTHNKIYFESPANGGSFYLDNILVYQGEKIREIPAKAYKDGKVEDVYVDEDPSDFTYFRSDSAYTPGKVYPNYAAYPKTGKITAERLDYRNANRGKDIVFEKLTSDDVYIDISIQKPVQWESNRIYKYFYFSADVSISSEELDCNFFVIRDREASGMPMSYLLKSDGTTLISNRGNSYPNKLKVGQYVTLETYLDLDSGLADIYVDGELLEANVNYNSSIKKLGMVRFGTQGSASGLGTLRIRNVEVTGLVKKPQDAIIERTSVYGDTSSIEVYLKDKISFQHFAEIIYKNGEKTPLTTPGKYENGEYYLMPEDVNTAFGIKAQVSDGKLILDGKSIDLGAEIKNGMIPVKALANNVLKKYVLDDGYGMILTSDEPMFWDLDAEIPHFMQEYVVGYFTRPSILQQMNAFLTFERPTAKEIQKAFNEHTDNGKMHPRLMGTKEDFDKVLKDAETDPTLKSIIDQVIKQAEAIIPKAPVVYKHNDDYRLWEVSFQYMRQMEVLSLAYQLTKDQKYADRAWLDIKNVCSFPDFNEAHAIDCGMIMTGMAFSYDWLYHALTKQQRAIMEEATLRMGIGVMDRAFYMGLPSGAIYSATATSMQQTSYFTKWRSNYVPYITVGLVGSALAFAEHDPELCFDLIEKSMRANEYAMFGLVPDGAWIEGVDYWEVTVGNLCRQMAFMETSLGTNYNLWKAQGFRESARAKASEESFLGSVAHSDATQNGGGVTSYAFPWYAKMLGQNDLAAIRQLFLSGKYVKYGMSAPQAFGLDVLYYTKVNEEDVKNFPTVQHYDGLESFSVRENYEDPSTFFFFSQAGQAFHYHGHNDCGSFVFDMDGVRWSNDLGKDSYDLHKNGLYYTIYRKRTEGHNTLTINNNDGWNQMADKYSALVKHAEGEGGAYGVYDMSELYRDVNSVMRGFYIDDNFRTVTVRDEIDVKKESEIYWFMHTKAEIEIIDEKTALLMQNGKTLSLQLETDCPKFELSVMEPKMMPGTTTQGGQNANEGFKKVAIKLNGNGKMNLTVRMSTDGLGKINTTPIDKWTAPKKTETVKPDLSYKLYVSGKLMDENTVIPLVDPGVIPEFEIVPNNPEMKINIKEDLKQVGTKIAFTIENADGTISQPARITYKKATKSLLHFFDSRVPLKATVTDVTEAANHEGNLLDNDITTRWTGKQADSTAILDYGEEFEFDTLSLGFWKGDTRKYSFTISISNDGENFTEIGSFTSSGDSDDYELYKLGNNYKARYVKFVNGGNTANKYANPTEILLLKSR